MPHQWCLSIQNKPTRIFGWFAKLVSRDKPGWLTLSIARL